MYCAECGKTLPEGARFCQACGTPVTADGSPTSSSPISPPTAPSAPAYIGHRPAAPAPSAYGPQGPAPTPPRRKREGLLPGVVTAVIILLAGLGVGLYFGLSGGSSTDAASTVTTVAASSTTAPTTTEPPTTTSTVLETTTSEPTTTTEQTTTTLAVDPALAARMAEWEALLETIPGSGPEKVAEVAAWLTPKDQAQSRAAEIVEWWSTAGDPEEIIQDEPFVGVIRTIVSPDGANATILSSYDLICRDGLTTRSLGSTTWKLDDGQWMRTVDYAAPAPVDGSVAFFGGSVRAGDLLWSPDYLNELKHLAAKGGPDTPGMFLAVEFFVRNSGPTALAPSGFQVTAIDANGKEYGLSQAADNWWNLDVEDRETKIAPGEYTWLWYTFEIPEGADLQSFQYRVTLPEV